MATILVVDDRPQNREFLTTLLGYRQHQVVESKDGADALKLARQVHPDLVISDIMMPGMDGYELVRNLRGDNGLAHVPVVFLTAHYLEREARALAGKLGVAEVLCKPCEPEEVLRVVDEVLRSPHAAAVALPEEFDRDHLRLITNKLSKQSDEVYWVKLRLEALVDAIHLMSQERDPETLVGIACREAREIIGSASAIACISPDRDSDRPQCCVRGAETRVDREICGWLQQNPTLQHMQTSGASFRTKPADLRMLDLQVESLMGVPVASPAHKYGWMCFLNKLGEDQFTETDERLARAFADQVAVAYEAAQLSQTMKRQIGMLSQSNANLEQFADAVGHDLTEPFRTVYNYSNLLVKRLGDSADPDIREFTAFIRDGVTRMRMLMDGLLAYSQVGRDHAAPVDATDPTAVLSDAIKNCTEAIGACQAAITFDPLPRVKAQPVQLLQIFQNLIGNAMKYRREGVRPEIHVSARHVDGEIEFAVGDNGIGIKPEHFKRIFVLFERLHRDEYPGIGLGLAICTRLVQSLGGRMWVESEPGKGSTFYFTAPAES